MAVGNVSVDIKWLHDWIYVHIFVQCHNLCCVFRTRSHPSRFEGKLCRWLFITKQSGVNFWLYILTNRIIKKDSDLHSCQGGGGTTFGQNVKEPFRIFWNFPGFSLNFRFFEVFCTCLNPSKLSIIYLSFLEFFETYLKFFYNLVPKNQSY